MTKTPKAHTIWAERYRPTTLETFIGDPTIRECLTVAIETNDLQNLIFHGKTGTGKTTAAKILMNTLKCDYLYLNGSDDNGIDTVREKIKTFVSTASFKPLKIVVLDDCQNFTAQAQQALLNLIETYSKSTRFIFTCNALGKLIPALQGRCDVKKIEPPVKADVAEYLCMILDQEGIEYDIDDLVKIINKHFPDIRKCVQVIQASSSTGTLTLTGGVDGGDYIDQIISILGRKGGNPLAKFTSIRQIVADNGLLDFTDVYRSLYERLSEFAPNSQGEVCIYLAEGEYESNFVPDREITFMKVIHNIINIK